MKRTLSEYGFENTKQQQGIIRELEKIRKFYIAEYVLREQKKPFEKYIKIISKMERMAAKFQSEISDAGPGFYEFCI